MQASVYEGEATGPFIATLAPYNQGGEKLDMFGGRTRQWATTFIF